MHLPQCQMVRLPLMDMAHLEQVHQFKAVQFKEMFTNNLEVEQLQFMQELHQVQIQI